MKINIYRKPICLLVIILFCGRIYSATDDWDFLEWMSTYYQTKDITHFKKFWNKVVENKILESDAITRRLTIGFSSQVFRTNDSLLSSCIKNIKDFPVEQRDALRVMLWWANSEASRKILEDNGDTDFLTRSPVHISEKDISDVEDTVFCYAWYCATGDTSALEPLVNAIKCNDAGEKASKLREYSTGALAEAYKRNEKLKDFLEKVLPRGNTYAAVALKVILASAKNQPAKTDQPAKEPAKAGMIRSDR